MTMKIHLMIILLIGFIYFYKKEPDIVFEPDFRDTSS